LIVFTLVRRHSTGSICIFAAAAFMKKETTSAAYVRFELTFFRYQLFVASIAFASSFSLILLFVILDVVDLVNGFFVRSLCSWFALGARLSFFRFLF